MASRSRSVVLALATAGLLAGLVAAAPVAAATPTAPWTTAPGTAPVTSTLAPDTADTGATAAGDRSFSCTGNLGLPYTFRTVTGQLTARNVPYAVNVAVPGGAVDSSHPARATLVGAAGSSWLHAGYNNWDVTGANPNGDLYNLHVPPVLPGMGGYFDADLEISFAGGTAGGWQIPMFDCKVTGGATGLAFGNGPRAFACAGALDVNAAYTVTGQLTLGNVPFGVKVTQTRTAAVLSSRVKRAALVGAVGSSWLHAGYNNWDVTGANPNGDLFNLHVSPVLPRVGGFFDADLEVSFAGGTAGGVQVPMFDCTVK